MTTASPYIDGRVLHSQFLLDTGACCFRVRDTIAAGRGRLRGLVTAEPDMPQSRWTGITEELVTPGPAPLTAESVSLAFQRDGRRYDNGFPLY